MSNPFKIVIDVTANIDVEKKLKALQDPKFRKFAHGEWHKLVKPYVPRDTGRLYEDVTISDKGIKYNAPYAKIVYDGHFNFKQDKAPKASRRWDAAAAPMERAKLTEKLQQYIDNGGLDLKNK